MGEVCNPLDSYDINFKSLEFVHLPTLEILVFNGKIVRGKDLCEYLMAQGLLLLNKGKAPISVTRVR